VGCYVASAQIHYQLLARVDNGGQHASSELFVLCIPAGVLPVEREAAALVVLATQLLAGVHEREELASGQEALQQLQQVLVQ
jgi:hypothetical protein